MNACRLSSNDTVLRSIFQGKNTKLRFFEEKLVMNVYLYHYHAWE